MAQPNKPPKTMSSRLATMKFMQRSGVANAPVNSPPKTPDGPPAKKQRLSSGSVNSSPSTTPRAGAPASGGTPAPPDQMLGNGDAADRGETKWYLSFNEPQRPSVESPLQIVSAGYSVLDGSGPRDDQREEEEGVDHDTTKPFVVNGRRSFGKFNKAIERRQDPDLSSSPSESESDSDHDEGGEDEDNEDSTGANAMIAQARKEASEKAKAERKARKKAVKEEAERLAAERRKKNINLNQLQSISGPGTGRGGGPGKGSSGLSNVVCHRCNEKGHMQKDCPEKRRNAGHH